MSMEMGDWVGLRFNAARFRNALDHDGIVHWFDICNSKHASAAAHRFQNQAVPFFGDHR